MNFILTSVDRMGSVLQSLNPESGVTQQQRYSAYGDTIHSASNVRAPGFNGERCDPLTGTTHLGNGYRAYNPTLMRFHCPDSMSPFEAGGINTYAYCTGDPINNSDPSGHMSAQAGVGIGLGVLGLALGAATFGVSIAAKVAVLASVSAIATGIASGATEDSNPEASAALGWLSLASGIAGAVGGIVSSGIKLQMTGSKISTAFNKGLNGGRTLPPNRAVVTQGTFGVFSTKNLNLSMPAVQSCIGVYGEDKTKQLLMCAHFDTNKNLGRNMRSLMHKMNDAGMSPKTNIKIFGGDGRMAYLRCGKPSTYIGDEIADIFTKAGYQTDYTNDYSGLLGRTYYFDFNQGNSLVTSSFTDRMESFYGVDNTVLSFSQNRIRKRPENYSDRDAIMMNVSSLYR